MPRPADPRYPEGREGWQNRETWAVALWLGNDNRAVDEDATAAALQGSDALREYVEEYLGESPGGLAGDILTGALAWVDWDEIAQARADKVRRDLTRALFG